MYIAKFAFFFNEGGSHKLLHIHVMTNYKKVGKL